MKIKRIIDDLINHNITRQDAEFEINSIVNGFRNKDAIEFDVIKVSSSVEDNHGYLYLKIPYQYSKIEKINVGDKVDVSILP